MNQVSAARVIRELMRLIDNAGGKPDYNAVRWLELHEYVYSREHSSDITLTESGEKLAESIIRSSGIVQTMDTFV